MTNAQETNVKQEPLSEQAFLDTLINLCDDLAWGRPASEDRLFALTKAQRIMSGSRKPSV